MTSFIDDIKNLFSKKEEEVSKTPFDFISKEEVSRAKAAFDLLLSQKAEYRIREEISKTPDKSLEEFLKGKEFKSEDERNLFIKVYNLRHKAKEVLITPFPLDKVQRIIINGKPYVEFKGDKGFIAPGIGPSSEGK